MTTISLIIHIEKEHRYRILFLFFKSFNLMQMTLAKRFEIDNVWSRLNRSWFPLRTWIYIYILWFILMLVSGAHHKRQLLCISCSFSKPNLLVFCYWSCSRFAINIQFSWYIPFAFHLGIISIPYVLFSLSFFFVFFFFFFWLVRLLYLRQGF